MTVLYLFQTCHLSNQNPQAEEEEKSILQAMVPTHFPQTCDHLKEFNQVLEDIQHVNNLNQRTRSADTNENRKRIKLGYVSGSNDIEEHKYEQIQFCSN